MIDYIVLKTYALRFLLPVVFCPPLLAFPLWKIPGVLWILPLNESSNVCAT